MFNNCIRFASFLREYEDFLSFFFCFCFIPPAAACRALDAQTPPSITVEGRTLRIRYNSMRVAPGNFAYTLRTLR